MFEGDATWTSSDDDLIEQAKAELAVLGLVDPEVVEAGYVVRMPKAYPVYDGDYEPTSAILARAGSRPTPPTSTRWGATACTSTTTRTTRCTRPCSRSRTSRVPTTTSGTSTSRSEYHETKSAGPAQVGDRGTGRDAPIIPRSAFPVDHPLHVDETDVA